MEEIIKNIVLELEAEDGVLIKGRVFEYTRERIALVVDNDCVEDAKKLKVQEAVIVSAYTNFGIKDMISHVIAQLSDTKRLIIENASVETVEKKRETVRAVDDFFFNTIVNNSIYNVKCLNISAGGIAFTFDENIYEVNQLVEVIFPEKIFSKKITCNIQIIKVRDDYCSARFIDLNLFDQSLIVKKVFAILAKEKRSKF